LTPRQDVISLYDDNTLRKGLEIMRSSGYSFMPVTSRDNIYAGVVGVSDFLWYLIPEDSDEYGNVPVRPIDGGYIRDIMDRTSYPAVSVTASIEELMDRIMEHNFVPVVDGRNSFMGIITRHSVMEYFRKRDTGIVERIASASYI
jgi:CBS domain-containing protein